MLLQCCWQNPDHSNCSHRRQHSRKSEKWRKKWNMSQEVGLSPECHLAPYFFPSLTQSAGKTNEILGAVSWCYTTLFSYQTQLPSPQMLCRNDVFPGTSGSHQRLLKQSCDKYAIDTDSYRDVSVSVRGLLEMMSMINRFSLSQNRKKEDFRWMLCSFISMGKRHQHERTTSIKDQ